MNSNYDKFRKVYKTFISIDMKTYLHVSIKFISFNVDFECFLEILDFLLFIWTNESMWKYIKFTSKFLLQQKFSSLFFLPYEFFRDITFPISIIFFFCYRFSMLNFQCFISWALDFILEGCWIMWKIYIKYSEYKIKLISKKDNFVINGTIVKRRKYN